jgi:hypothetical protein
VVVVAGRVVEVVVVEVVAADVVVVGAVVGTSGVVGVVEVTAASLHPVARAATTRTEVRMARPIGPR